ncbi:MAG: radical SAM protein, partial [Dehalococcoidales bacterium]
MVRCDTCQWRCRIHPGKLGVCKMYRNDEGRLYNLNYARVSSLAVDPIEKKPLFHFHPGTMVFSMGSWGCNFHCSGCQNWEIACPEKPDQWQTSREIPPEAAVEMARSSGAAGIAWTYNEPGIWLEYTLDTAKLARQSNLYTVYVTNGYSTPEALDTVGPYLDAWRVDI